MEQRRYNTIREKNAEANFGSKMFYIKNIYHVAEELFTHFSLELKMIPVKKVRALQLIRSRSKGQSWIYSQQGLRLNA